MTEQKLIDYFYTLFYDECCENFADIYDTKMFVEDCLRLFETGYAGILRSARH